ncbi:uncharacterized protein Dana_GF12666 [Drosophila ananassae]|uniref:Uncharacterized protein n=1 Tax=Drosophila ananassae TaxID=7217 RepID=B3MHJ5_DROAN|nr:uncharacterized protein LOC6495515 [Drosophila ananassae]EDV35831.1 uncharacterized protein Dana_GF12666 [Drosophila ananassae]
MKVVAILLLSTLSVALVVAFPGNHLADAAVPAGGLYAVAVAPAADAGSAESPTSEADQNTNSIRKPRNILSKLFHHEPKTVVVQPIIIERPAYQPNYGYQNPNIYYNQGRRIY